MIVLEGGRLVAGERDAPGQERLVVLEARGAGQRGKESAQVPVGLDAVGLGGFDQRVEIGARGGAAPPRRAGSRSRRRCCRSGHCRLGRSARAWATAQRGSAAPGPGGCPAARCGAARAAAPRSSRARAGCTVDAAECVVQSNHRPGYRIANSWWHTDIVVPRYGSIAPRWAPRE